MTSIGDLANELAKAVYEYRIPFALASVVVAIGLLLLARRLGWLAAARRHPGRTLLGTALALVVLAPVGWYLGSPIFIRTALVEPAPVVGLPIITAPSPAGRASTEPAGPSPTTSAQPNGTSDPDPTVVPSVRPTPAQTPGPTAEPTAEPTPFAATPFAAQAVAGGQFQGTDDFHFGRGSATIIEIAPGRYHLRLEDFSVRNGPDLYVYLSPDPNGYTDDSLEVGVLKATDGSFGYDLPEGIDPARFRSALIWCKQFSHLFATATFAG